MFQLKTENLKTTIALSAWLITYAENDENPLIRKSNIQKYTSLFCDNKLENNDVFFS